MDVFALGTPILDSFVRGTDAMLQELGLAKGATNHLKGSQFGAILSDAGQRLVHRYPGDNARNVCEGIASLGGSCGYQGAVGADGEASEIWANLKECGIGNFLQKRNGRTGRIVAIITPDLQRTFAADLGVAMQCGRFEKGAIADCKYFFASSITFCGKSSTARLCMRYFAAAVKMKKKIAISLESPPMVAANRTFLLACVKKYADALFLNDEEAEALLGKKYESKLASFKPSCAIYLKLGGRGAILYHKGSKHAIHAQKVKVVDTTGAGDAFAAGALYGLCRKYSPLASGKVGSMLAAKVVGKFGAGIPLGHTRP